MPELASQLLPTLRPTSITRCSSLPSAATNIAVASPLVLRVTARCGTRKLFSATPSSITARTYMPGSSSRSGLGNAARTASVPVLWLTLDSPNDSVPV